MESKSSLKEDIQKAERVTLIVSWIGIASAIAVMSFAIWGI